MSELQIGDQQSKPVDTNEMLRKADAAIDGQFKTQISTFAGAMQVLKGSSESDALGSLASGDAYDHAAEKNQPKPAADSMFAGKTKKKGAKGLSDLQATTDAMGHRLSRNKMRQNQRILNAAWIGSKRNIKDKDGGSGSSRDEGLVEELNALRDRLAVMPQGLKQNPSLLPGVGLGHIYEAITSINKERQDPSTDAVISGTGHDMDQFKDKFKTLDSGLKQQVYDQGGAEMKKKIEPLMSVQAPQPPQGPQAPQSN